MKYIGVNIRHLRTQAGLGQDEFGKSVGLTRDNIASYERGTEPKLNALMKIGEVYQVSIDDLINKDLTLCAGSPELPHHKNGKKIANRLDEPGAAFLYSPKNSVPLVSAEAFAGLANNMFSIEENEIQERYVVPDFENIDFMIRVKGSSMYPKYSSGDVVACRILKQRSFIQWNKVHVIATKEQGILIKRLKKGADDKFVTAISDNKDYDPFDVPWEEITSIALVVGVIRLE